MTKDDKNGWQGVPGGETWKCPECGETSPIEDWEECRPYCEDCGDHDGRMCPMCGKEYDHVWGAETLAEANKREV